MRVIGWCAIGSPGIPWTISLDSQNSLDHFPGLPGLLPDGLPGLLPDGLPGLYHGLVGQSGLTKLRHSVDSLENFK